MPSIGQLGDAHLMIVSRTHETALANLTPGSRKELISLLADTRNWLKAKLGGYDIVFENGDPIGLGRMNCSVSHLHVHVVASRRHRLPNLTQSIYQFGAEPISTLEDVATIRDSYSFVDTAQTGLQLIRKRLPSQTLRKLIAFEIGMPAWDWREASREDQLCDLAVVARSELSAWHNTSPTRPPAFIAP